MNITSYKMPMIWGVVVLMMGLLYACPDAADSGRDSTPPTLKAGGITYERIAQGTAGTATPKSSTIRDLSTLKFSMKPIGTHTGEQTPPTIAEDGSITTTTATSAGSYRVTITPDGITILGNPITVDFYVSVKPADIGDLDNMLKQAITDYGLTGDFNYIDTSEVTTMSYLFSSEYTPGSSSPEADSTRTYIANFNGDISKWDVSSVTNFSAMFGEVGASPTSTGFNQDISKWDVSAGKDFSSMFLFARKFNQDISEWKVDKGTKFNSMFHKATKFNQDIGRWNVSAGTNFRTMFQEATAFNQNIGGWTVTAGKDFSNMFNRAIAFNQDVSSWNLNPESVNITNMFLNSGVTDPPSWYTP